MSWVLSLAGSGGTAVSQGGHETRPHRVRGAFPIGVSLLVAATLALAGCGSSSSSTVTINPQEPQPEPEIEPQTGDGDGGQTVTQQQQQQPQPEPEPEPQTGGGSGEGEGDGGQGAGGGTPPTDTTSTDDGGTTITQQQQPPQEPLEPEPEPEPQPVTQQPPQRPQNSGGNLGSSRSPAGTSGGITRSGFDSIEAHSHIKDELFPIPFWKLNSYGYTEYGFNFVYKIKIENDRIDAGDYSGRIRIGTNVYLTEDTNTKVPDSYGWQGKRLTHGNTEAYIYTKIEDNSRYYDYGWWLNKDNWSSFANYYNHGDNDGAYNDPVDPIGRTGTATYVGGAGGYYAFVHGEKGVLKSYPFDAREPGISGEFRAKTRLEVNFTNNTISGKILNFTNPDGTPIRNNDGVKDWTVELLNGSYDPDYNLAVVGNKTKWYDGEHLIEGDGRWEGQYFEDTSIFMGQFLASHGAIGKMVGSFGTNRQ